MKGEAGRFAPNAEQKDPNTPRSVRLTRETQYALRGLCALARRAPGTVSPLMEVASAEALPPSFLAKIFQKLARHGILTSHRGAGQGYELSVAPAAISLLDIVTAVQGPEHLEQCVFWGGRCGEEPCLLHDRWLRIRAEIRTLLEHTSLAELAAQPGTPMKGRAETTLDPVTHTRGREDGDEVAYA